MEAPKAIAILLALLTSAVSAQETSASSSAEDVAVENIIITGQRMTNAQFQWMRGFVAKVGNTVNSDYGFARIDGGACIRIYNSPKPVAEFISKRLSTIAREAGLEEPKAGCIPNIEIMFTGDARAVAAKLVEQQPAVFQPYGTSEGTIKGRNALYDFKTSDAAVRWWQITVPVDRIGTPLIRINTAEENTDSNPFAGVPIMQGGNSRFITNTRELLQGSIIIVDTSKLGSTTWDQLADYLAMVSLAEVDPRADVSDYESILGLFTDTKPVAELSAWDKSYLKALYSINMFMKPVAQRGELASRLRDELEHYR